MQWQFNKHGQGGVGKYDIVDKGEGAIPENYTYRQRDAGRYAPTTSFSGSDMLVQFVFPGAKPVSVGTASTVSYSTFRDTRQVRTLGRISPKGITRGPRTVAGTIVFTVINQHVVNDILDKLKENGKNYSMYDKIKPDELPSFDVVITFANEYGQTAHMVIYGVHMFEEGKTLSIEDILTETIVSFKGRDIDHMKGPWQPGMNSFSGQVLRGHNEPVGKFGLSDLENTDAYNRTMEVWRRMRETIQQIRSGGE